MFIWSKLNIVPSVVWCVGGNRPSAHSGSDCSVPAPMVWGPPATGGAEAGTMEPVWRRDTEPRSSCHLSPVPAPLFSRPICASCEHLLMTDPNCILTSQSSSDLSMYSLHLSHLWVCASISLSYYPLSIFSRYHFFPFLILELCHVLRFQAVCTNRAGHPLQMFSYFLHSMSSVLSNKSQKLSMECLNNIVSSPQ